jgi:tetratricopeptide (TPR) repeat protein
MDEWQSAEDHVDRAVDLYHRGRWSEAEAEFRKAISHDPSRGDWHFNLGLTLEAAGRDGDALTCYEMAASLLPSEYEPSIAAGCAAARLARHAEALAHFERANEIAPEHEGGYARRIEMLSALGRHDEAETVYFLAQQALEEYPLCLKAMGESLLDRGNLDRAGWCFREALRQDPSIGGVRSRLASVLAATGRPNRALQMYLQDLRDDPGNVATLLSYGSLLADLKRHPEAAEKFRRVLELEPANAEAHWRLGELAVRAGRLETARSEFELALQLEPDRPDAHLHLAEVRRRLGHRPEARRHLAEQTRRLVAMERPVPASVLRTAELVLESSEGRSTTDARRAIELLDHLHEFVRGDPEALRLLAFACFSAGDLDRGASVSRRLLRLDPGSIAAMHNLSLSALESGRLLVAWMWWRKGSRTAPTDEGLRRIRTQLVLATIVERIAASRNTVGRLLAIARGEFRRLVAKVRGLR